MKASDLIDFLINKASHCVINDERSKNSDHALMASGKKSGKPKQNKRKEGTKEKTNELEIICYNCNKPGHKQFESGPKVVEKKAKVLGKRSQLRLKRP